jgi:hypothetical protein
VTTSESWLYECMGMRGLRSTCSFVSYLFSVFVRKVVVLGEVEEVFFGVKAC